MGFGRPVSKDGSRDDPVPSLDQRLTVIVIRAIENKNNASPETIQMTGNSDDATRNRTRTSGGAGGGGGSGDGT
jgi:hypothetical protein